MAIVKTDKFSIIRGQFGGVYFKAGKDGIHCQPMPRHVNYPRVGVQGFMRDSFSAMSGFWLLLLLVFYSALWAAFATYYAFKDKDGNDKYLTGYNWFIHYAMIGVDEGEPYPFWKPPHSPGELPDWIGVYRGYYTYTHTPDMWPADSPSGYYWLFGEWNGKPMWTMDSHMWYVWYDGAKWCITPQPGIKPDGFTFVSMRDTPRYWYKNTTSGEICLLSAGNVETREVYPNIH